MIKYGYHLGKINECPRENLAALKAAGFDAVLLHLGGEYPDQKLAEDVAAEGLVIDNVHGPAKGTNSFWIPGPEGDELTDRFIDHMERCAAIGVPRIIYHVSSGNNYPPIKEVGIDRFSRLAEAAERLDIDMCLENQRFFHFIDYIYSHIDSKRLKFCYDSGHESCFSQTKIALPKYRDRLAALHLHDNDGGYEHDQHLLPGHSTGVDWDYVRRWIADYDGVISLEVKTPRDIPHEVFYAEAIKAVRFVRSE